MSQPISFIAKAALTAKKPSQFCTSTITKLFRLSLIIVIVTSVFGCHEKDSDDNDNEVISNHSAIAIDPSTTEIMLKVKNPSDGMLIPVYIALPADRNQPFKAMVILHGSGGAWSDKDNDNDGTADDCNVGKLSRQNAEWKALLLSNSLAIAIPDSYSPRGTCENEGAYKVPPLKFKISGTFLRNGDALETLELLRNLVWKDTKKPVIDPQNIGVIGFSDGGTAVLSALYDTNSTPLNWAWKQKFDDVEYQSQILPPVARPSKGGFKFGISYYAGGYHNGYYGSLCQAGRGIYKSYSDILFHIPELDPLTQNGVCIISTMEQNGGGKATVYRYSNTGHGFDGTKEPESGQARQRSINFIHQKFNMTIK